MAATALHVVITGDPKPFQAALAKAGAATNAFGAKQKTASARMASAGSMMTKGVTLPLIGIGVAASKMSLDFNASMGKIGRLVGASDKQIAEYKGGVLDMAKVTGHAPKELADALFFVTSAGLKGKVALDAVEQAAKGSAAGLGETKTVADALTSAMNAYGPSTLSASRSTDVLVGAVREGKMEADQLAPALGRVIPLAQTMGVSFDQVGASIASLTRVGLGPAEAATALRGTLATFAKPTNKTVEALDKAGLSIKGLRQEIKDKGLLETLTHMKGAAKENGVEMAQLFPNVRALTGVLALTGKNAKANAGIFKRMAAGTGDAGDAFDKLAGKPGFRLKQAFADIQAAMIRFGDTIVPAVVPPIADVLGAIGKLGEMFGKLPDSMKTTIVAIAAIVAVVGPLLALFGGIASGAAALGGVFGALGVAAAPVLLVVAAVAALGFGLMQAYKKSETFRKAVDTAFGAVKDAAQAAFEWVKQAASTVYTALAPFIQQVRDLAPTFTALGAAIGGAFATAWQIAQPAVSALLQVIGPMLGTAFTVLAGIVTRVVSAIGTTLRGLINVVKGVAQIVTGILTGDFGAAWSGVKSLFTGGVQMVLGTLKLLTAPLRAVIANAGRIITTVFGGAFKLLVGIVKTNMRLVLTALKAPLGLFKAAGTLLARGVSAGFRAALGVIVGAAKAIISAAITGIRAYLGAYKAAGLALINAVGAGIKAAAGAVVAAAKAIGSRAVAGLRAVGGAMLAAGRFLIMRVLTGVRNIAGQVVAGAKSVGTRAVAGLRAIGSAFYTAGVHLMEMLAKGVTAAAGKALDAVKGVAKKARDLLPFSEPKDKSSPLYGLGKSGEAIVDMVAGGITGRSSSFRASAAKAFSGFAFELDAQIADAQKRAADLQDAFTVADKQAEINSAQRKANAKMPTRRKGEKSKDFDKRLDAAKKKAHEGRVALAELRKEADRTQQAADIDFEIAGLERLKGFKDALGDISSSLTDVIDTAVGNRIDERLKGELAGIEDSAASTELKALRAADARAQRDAEDADIADKLAKAKYKQAQAEQRVVDAQHELERAQGSGSARLVSLATQRVNLANAAKAIADQGVAGVQADADAVTRSRRIDELEEQIQASKDAAEARAELARQGGDTEINIFRNTLGTQLADEVAQLETRKQNYQKFASDIAAILGPLGLVFTPSADQEAAIEAPDPTKASVAHPKKHKKRKRRAYGGMVAAFESTRINELGPEDVVLPAGSRVVPASSSDGGGPAIGQLVINQVGRAADDADALASVIGFRVATARR